MKNSVKYSWSNFKSISINNTSSLCYSNLPDSNVPKDQHTSINNGNLRELLDAMQCAQSSGGSQQGNQVSTIPDVIPTGSRQPHPMSYAPVLDDSCTNSWSLDSTGYAGSFGPMGDHALVNDLQDFSVSQNIEDWISNPYFSDHNQTPDYWYANINYCGMANNTVSNDAANTTQIIPDINVPIGTPAVSVPNDSNDSDSNIAEILRLAVALSQVPTNG